MLTFVFPGQGSQSKGMGGELFDEFGDLTAEADGVLGYSIKKLCLEDPDVVLSLTQYTQPALYVVNALSYLKRLRESGRKPDFVAGHSLGEYAALFAAGAFDFRTGVQLVKKRGELMARASGGGMAAVIGLSEKQVADLLVQSQFTSIDIANLNSPFQIVISGSAAEIGRAKTIFEEIRDVKMFVPLKTSGAFHSRYMETMKHEFETFMEGFQFAELKIPVISNVHARPYRQSEIQQNLVLQLTHPVKWTESIQYLMGFGEMDFVEVGPGKVLSGLIGRIQKEAEPLVIDEAEKHGLLAKEAVAVASSIVESYDKKKDINQKPDSGNRGSAGSLGTVVSGMFKTVQEKAKDLISTSEKAAEKTIKEPKARESEKPETGLPKRIKTAVQISAASLGSPEFKKDYNLRYAYLTGGMYRGIASPKMVIKMGKAGMMGFFGTGGLELPAIEAAIREIQQEISDGQSYGINLLHYPNDPEKEGKIVDLFLQYRVHHIEAAAFLTVTPALVKYRAKGLKRDHRGNTVSDYKIIAKVSRPEVAELFVSPAPDRILNQLLADGKITGEEADLARQMPLADDICAEADSAGHTDGGSAYALIPAMLKLRDGAMKKYQYPKMIRVGAAGGIGTPEAAGAAFILGADFIMTGSINQCTVEAATSEAVKELLQEINVQDTGYAPAGDMFELGARVQVLKKGMFFPVRANKLYDLYRQYNSLEEIDPKTRNQIQEKYFKRSFADVFQEIKSSYSTQEIERMEHNPKSKMAAIFKWYFGYSTQLALNGSEECRVDYQVHCGPALGAFNQWVKGTEFESWRNRHVDEIAVKLMNEAAEILNHRYHRFLEA